ncbi:hypothetical protein C8R45DRAFT_1038997 [Mycena sanguinolenta]|nr:hypothetical protein C8R45DRAFT_1038997 [Mycena sanguinolenta]
MPVLTRRAAREYNSIVRWLPNEILGVIMLYSSQTDLLTLCRTSRLIRNIATRLLYHTVSLSTGTQIEAWLRAMESHEHSRLAEYVRRFSIRDMHWTRNASPRTVEGFTSILSQLCRLEYLELMDAKFMDVVLGLAYFKHLSTLRYVAESRISPSLPSFLNRHPTITQLSISQYGPPQELHGDTIGLPNLTNYVGPSSFVCLLKPTILRPITSVHLVTYRYPDNQLKIEAALLQLATMTVLLRLVLVHSMNESTLLQNLAKHVPHVRSLELGKAGLVNGQMSHADTLEIATCLEKFDRLSVLGFVSADGGMEYDDRETVTRWGEACKSLSTIALRQWVWDRSEGNWTKTRIEIRPPENRQVLEF